MLGRLHTFRLATGKRLSPLDDDLSEERGELHQKNSPPGLLSRHQR